MGNDKSPLGGLFSKSNFKPFIKGSVSTTKKGFKELKNFGKVFGEEVVNTTKNAKNAIDEKIIKKKQNVLKSPSADVHHRKGSNHKNNGGDIKERHNGNNGDKQEKEEVVVETNQVNGNKSESSAASNDNLNEEAPNVEAELAQTPKSNVEKQPVQEETDNQGILEKCRKSFYSFSSTSGVILGETKKKVSGTLYDLAKASNEQRKRLSQRIKLMENDGDVHPSVFSKSWKKISSSVSSVKEEKGTKNKEDKRLDRKSRRKLKNFSRYALLNADDNLHLIKDKNIVICKNNKYASGVFSDKKGNIFWTIKNEETDEDETEDTTDNSILNISMRELFLKSDNDVLRLDDKIDGEAQECYGNIDVITKNDKCFKATNILGNTMRSMINMNNFIIDSKKLSTTKSTSDKSLKKRKSEIVRTKSSRNNKASLKFIIPDSYWIYSRDTPHKGILKKYELRSPIDK